MCVRVGGGGGGDTRVCTDFLNPAVGDVNR